MSGLSRVSSRLEKGKKTYTDRSAFHATLMHTQGNIPRQPKIDCRQDVGGGGWKSVVEENIPEDSSAERKETAGKSKSNSTGEINLKH